MANPPDHQGKQFRTRIRTSATPQQVWEAWADPEKLAHWFPDRATGKGETGEIMTWIFEKFGMEIPYKVLDSVPGEHFALRSTIPGWDRGIIEVIIEHAGGETVMTLVNSGFDEGAGWDEEYEGIASGWLMAVALLKYYLENHWGRPRTSLMAMRPAVFEYAQLKPYFVDPAKRALWLTAGISGAVLAITGREVCLEWKEIAGVLELKAFSMGKKGKALCVRACGWKLSKEEAARIEAEMQQSLDRLAGFVEPATQAAC